MTTDASTPALTRIASRLPNPVNLIGLALVALVVVWLIVNLIKSPAEFVEVILIGITNGCIYALVALGYTLVYGILELINFAHGDVFMLGGMFAVTFATWLRAAGGPGVALAARRSSILMICDGPLRARSTRRSSSSPTGRCAHAPRLAPLITAIGVSFILETAALIWKGPNYVDFPNVLPERQRCSRSAASSSRGRRRSSSLLTVPVLAAASLYLVQKTKQGKAMRATAQDMDASAIMGIDVNRTISFTFLLAGALAGAAGLVYALVADDGPLRPGLHARPDRVHRSRARRDRQPARAPCSARS